jgi:hypothetical protein
MLKWTNQLILQIKGNFSYTIFLERKVLSVTKLLEIVFCNSYEQYKWLLQLEGGIKDI